MLKVIGVEFEPLTDYDKYLMVEKGIRGGISQHLKWYMKVNNKHVEACLPINADSYLWCVDTNNLYVYSLSQYLLYKGFKWIDIQEKSLEY